VPGAAACAVCPAGSYAAAAGAVACTPCPAGTYNALPGGASLAACTPCSAGQFSQLPSQTIAAACAPCPPGTYQAGTGKSACTPCAKGTFNNNQGSSLASSCQACAAGTYSSIEGGTGIACLTCADGTFSPFRAATSVYACAACPVGSFSAGANKTACTRCPVGTFQDAQGQTACQLCQTGTYSDKFGLNASSQCTTCPGGYTTVSPGQTALSSCIKAPFSCQPGTTPPSKVPIFQQTSCVDLECPPPLAFQYGDRQSSSQCVGCAPGFFGTPGACAPCGASDICAGLGARPLWNFSKPMGIYSQVLADGAVLVRANSSAAGGAAAAPRGRALAPAPAAASPWTDCAPLTVVPQPGPPEPSTLGLVYTMLLASLLLVTLSLTLPFLTHRSWLLAWLLLMTDVLTMPFEVQEILETFLRRGHWRKLKRTTRLGAALTLLSVSGIAVLTSLLVYTYLYDNVLATIALLPYDDALFRAGGVPFMSATVPVSGDALTGLQVRLTAAGDACGVVARADAPSEAVPWSYQPPARCTPDGGVYQHAWTCDACTIPTLFDFSVSLDAGCQSMMLEVGSTTSMGNATVVSTGPQSGSADGLLTALKWTVKPLFYYSDNKISAAKTARGYALVDDDAVPTFARHNIEGGLATVKPLTATVDITVTFDLQSFIVVQTLTPKAAPQDVIAQFLGLFAIFGAAATMYTVIRKQVIERGDDDDDDRHVPGADDDAGGGGKDAKGKGGAGAAAGPADPADAGRSPGASPSGAAGGFRGGSGGGSGTRGGAPARGARGPADDGDGDPQGAAAAAAAAAAAGSRAATPSRERERERERLTPAAAPSPAAQRSARVAPEAAPADALAEARAAVARTRSFFSAAGASAIRVGGAALTYVQVPDAVKRQNVGAQGGSPPR